MCKYLFTCTNGNIQAIFRGRERARPAVIVCAVWVVGQVEIDHKAIVPKRLRFKITTGRVGLLASQLVGKRQKIPMWSSEDRQFCILPVDLETKPTITFVN